MILIDHSYFVYDEAITTLTWLHETLPDPDMTLRDVWNWLPTFRAVAETEHLPTAAERLHVTPAAISRTIGLLEDRLGCALFNRSGRRLVLNQKGQKLLEAVREGMAGVERGVHAVTEDPFSGPLRISSLGVLTNHFVLPAMLDLSREHPRLEPRLQNLRTRDAAEALMRGALDVAFVYEHMTFEGLKVQRLGESSASVYCGRGHPLFGAESLELDELLEHPFSVPAIGDTGAVMDGWPSDLPRRIGMRITLLTSNLEVCKSGRFITVLPDVTARPHVEAGELRRFGFGVVPAAAVFATWRATEEEGGRVRKAIEAVRARVERVSAQLEEDAMA
jgi:DNA-binding transcriptional LysR family regulator